MYKYNEFWFVCFKQQHFVIKIYIISNYIFNCKWGCMQPLFSCLFIEFSSIQNPQIKQPSTIWKLLVITLSKIWSNGKLERKRSNHPCSFPYSLQGTASLLELGDTLRSIIHCWALSIGNYFLLYMCTIVQFHVRHFS